MAAEQRSVYPVHENVDPLLAKSLTDPFGVLAALPRRRARQARGSDRDRGAHTPVPGLRLLEGQTIPVHPSIAFRGPLELWVRAQ